jgi:hypothetical protein
MNFSKTSYLTCSIAAVLGTGAAHAVVPTTTPDLVVYAGGGSAEPQPVEAAFCRNYSNVDLYVDNGALSNGFSKSYLVLYGTSTGANAGVPSGKNVLFIYKFNGGSYANGGVPQQGTNTGAGTAEQLTYPTTASILGGALIGAAATQGTVCTAAQKGLPTYQYTPALSNSQIPDFGITDLEVPAFSGFNNPTNNPLVTVGSADLVYDLVEGVAVTNSLYTGKGPSGTTLTGINSKTNFSRAEVAAILAGAITDWHNVYADNGQPVAPAGTGIILIDRNVGSGTKTAGSSYFLGYPGLGGNALSPNSVTNVAGTCPGTPAGNCLPANGPNNAGYTPGAVSCATTAVQDIEDTSSAAVVNDLITTNGCSKLAIAILSVDNPQALAPTTGQYDFVKLDQTSMDLNNSSDNINGTVGSSYINVIDGSYDFFYQVNFNQRSGFNTSAPANNVAFANSLKTVMQLPSLAGVNFGSQFPLATNGIVADADRNATVAKGVTVVSRGGNSSGTVKPVLPPGQAVGTIVAGSDPL